MTTLITETIDTTVSATPLVDQKRKIEEDDVNNLLQLLANTLEPKEEDKEQVSFVTALQQNRQFLLRYAMQSYMDNPRSASLLEGVTSLIGHMEKTVRDDRKERAKKQENQDNVVSFKQMLDAMNMIKTGTLAIPVFDFASFMPDPSKSLIDGLDVKPISENELVQGNQICDIEGNPV